MRIESIGRDRGMAISGYLIGVSGAIAALVPPGVTKNIVVALGFALGCLAFIRFRVSAVKWWPIWDRQRIVQLVRAAPSGSSIRIIQTWLGDRESLVPVLREEIIAKKKKFSIQVLLMNPRRKALLDARALLRRETTAEIRANIQNTVSAFAAFSAELADAKADSNGSSVEVRFFDHIPFGPYFEVGDKMLLGFYLSNESSQFAPMVEVQTKDCRESKVFRESFQLAWEQGNAAEAEGP